VTPSLETVADGTYQPLSRPLFVYVNKQAAERKEIQAYIAYFLNQGRPLVREVGYIPLPDRAYRLAQERFDRRIAGSVFGGKGSKVGVTVEELLSKQ
jgi:phosphate transport system substrate-binding protein